MAKVILVFLAASLAVIFVLKVFFNQKEFFSRAQIGNNLWNIEVVSSLADRAKGLSGRESLEKDSGMLFIFPKSNSHGIWMKDMNFAIDIIWIDQNRVVVDLKEGVKPESYPEVFKPRANALYVLEINSGEAAKAEIKIGDLVKFF